MQATTLDLRRRMKDVLAALDRDEKVTLTHRGRRKGVIVPCAETVATPNAAHHPAFGMWRDREELRDVDAFVRRVRRNRQQ